VVRRPGQPGQTHRPGQGALWLVAALAIALLPGTGIRALAVFVGVALVVDGAADVLGALRATRDERVAALVHGVAAVVLGLLALAWPGVTLIVISVIFGLRLAWFGVATTWAAIRGSATERG
jgi:hypothetical protein